MALISSFTSRRLADRKPPATKQIISFKIGQEWLAVSTDMAQKVVPLQTLCKDQDLSIPTSYEGKELRFFDIDSYIAEEKITQEIDIKKGYLILFETPQKTLITILIPAAPVLRRVNESSLLPMSLIPTVTKHMRMISQCAIRLEDESLIFLLDYEYLMQIATV
jgi:chemotaxis signal transduction protein